MGDISQQVDQKLHEILDRLAAARKSSKEIKKELCLYICVKMLSHANFDTEDSAKQAFLLHYGEALLDHYRKEKYPNLDSASLDKSRKGYLMGRIKEQIWNTIWKIHQKQEVCNILIVSKFSVATSDYEMRNE